MNTIQELQYRATAPTPPFFQKLRKVGLIVAAVGTATVAAPGVVPEIVQVIAGYAITAGTILVSICQLTVDESSFEEKLLADVDY